MDKNSVIYICPVCFQVCESERQCHEHLMVRCNPGPINSERRKPITDRFGNMVSRAPCWFLEATGQIPAYTPLSNNRPSQHF